ncbi:MAG TPA: hypothetical protein VKZ74_06770 [Natronosporangium sp.]|nr:hypothetical protein [Natronosporangium sp.]
MSRRPARDVPRWGAAPRWVETGDELDDWDTAGTVGRSTRAQATVTLLLRGVLWTGIALAVVLGLVNFAAPLTAGPPPPAGPASEPPPVPPPGGCAELVVAAWLNGDVNLLSGVPGMPRGEIEPGRREAVRTYTASVTPGDVGWGYVIGAEVRVRDDEDGWRDAGVQFFSVTMVPGAGGCQGWVPAALPAQVAAPVLTGPQPPYPVYLPATGTELSETLTAFFTGMLTGEGNPERYVAPGTVVPVLAPPPYREVAVTELRTTEEAAVDRSGAVPPDGTVVPLLVTVATDEDYLPLVYPVTVGVRGGRWEVIAIEPLVGTNGD